MNPFERARREAYRARSRLVPGREHEPIAAAQLLSRVEEVIELAIERVPPAYPDLGGSSAVLRRDQRFIFVSTDFAAGSDAFAALVGHELGHWFLDATKAVAKVADLKQLFAADGSPAIVKVEAYGARERQELQANVFARELLLPRDVARGLAAAGQGPARVAHELGIPLEFVRQQMLDALLLPEFEESVSVLHAPSPDQRRAAEARERFANVIAGPGTGKTSTLIHRVKYLIDQKGVEPARILVLTFTNKAAFELVERLRSAAVDGAADIWAGTFHAFGLEFLRKYYQHFGLNSDVNVADRLNAVTLLASTLPQLRLNYYLRLQDPYDWLGPVVTAIKRLKEELVSPTVYRESIPSLPNPGDELRRQREDVASLYEQYEALLAKHKMVDFGDLIGKPALAIRNDRVPYSAFVDRFDYILVDEYQDVTHAMVELLRALAHGKSLWVVGDVRQAIHHWRGASVKSLLRFNDEFIAHAGGDTIGAYALDNNRRSSEEILRLVEQVGVQHALQDRLPLVRTISTRGASGAVPKVITSQQHSEVAEAIADGIGGDNAAGVRYGEQAVLCRNSADVQRVAEVLERRRMPILYVGELAQRREVKRLLCLMQLLVERQPRGLVGLADVPGLAMPMADIRVLLNAAKQDVRWQRGRWLRDVPPGVSPAGLTVIGTLRTLLGRRTHNCNPWDFVCDVLLDYGVGVPPHTDQSVAAWVTRIALWQFAYSVRNGDGEMKQARLSRYLLRQRLRQRIGETYGDRELPPESSALDAVRLQTVHGSKGLEHEAVHLGYADAVSYGTRAPYWDRDNTAEVIVPPEVLGSTDDEHAFEEAVERNNLLYVALSRAKTRLRVYQHTEFGRDALAPQLLQNRRCYDAATYTAAPNPTAAVTPVRPFEPSAIALPFVQFRTYSKCPLQYWYSNVLALGSEGEVDTAIRARSCVMRSLRAVAKGVTRAPGELLAQLWAHFDLPDVSSDPGLNEEVARVYGRGVDLVNGLQGQGATFAEPISTLAGARLTLPWGLMEQGSATFHAIRLSTHGVFELIKLLRPVLSGLADQGTRVIRLHDLGSGAFHDVPPSGRVSSTNAFKAMTLYAAGDNEPRKGRHCARCAYLTLCPTAPAISPLA